MSERMKNMVIIIMAGGAGTRFWPLSTEKNPKQFLTLFGDKSLLQMSFDRISTLVPPEKVLVLTHKDFIPQVQKQLPLIPQDNIIGEPARKYTAAAVMLAALLSRKRFGNPVMTILTADHLIKPFDSFQKHIRSAARMAEKNDVLYTFGIVPTYPAVGFGYLECGELIVNDDGIKHYRVRSFKEKPDIDTASQYVKSGKFYWNSGMFIWTVDTILRQLNLHLPHHVESISEAIPYDKTDRWDNELRNAFESLHPISIDCGIMEKALNVRCVVSNFSWSDVGGWLALKDHLPADDATNSFNCRLIDMDARNNLIFCEEPDDTVMIIGVNDLVVVRAGSNLLVVDKDRTEDIKKLSPVVIKETKRENHRPWGYYQILSENPECKVKRIVVYPGM